MVLETLRGFTLMIALLIFNFTLSGMSSTTVGNDRALTVDQFVQLNFDEFEELAQKNLKFKDRIRFHALKRVLKRKLKKKEIDGQQILHEEEEFKINWGAFALGFLLGNIGLIISLIVSRKKRHFLRSTVIGFLINFALGLILLLIFVPDLIF